MTGEQLFEISRMVRRQFAANAKRVGHGRAGDDTVCDLDDVHQEAALAIWKYYLRKKLPLEGRRTLYYQIGARAAGKEWKRVRSLTRLTDHAIDKLKMTGDVSEGIRVPLVGCGWGDEDFERDDGGEFSFAVDPPAPETTTAIRLIARDQLRERKVLRDAIAAAWRAALPEIARQARRSRKMISRSGPRFQAVIQRDPTVRAARRAMIEGMETTP